MDSAALLSCLATDGMAVADAAAGHLDRPVDSCPEWTVRQLVGHLGSVHSWAGAVVRARGERVSRSRQDPAPEDDTALLRWYRAGVDELVTALSVDPETPAWTFSPSRPDNAGWWQRRQALETAVHRWDAQSAAGGAAAAPIGASLAVEGIDELLVDFLPRPALVAWSRRSQGDVPPSRHGHVRRMVAGFRRGKPGHAPRARQGRHGPPRAGVGPLPLAVEPPVAGGGRAGGVRPTGDGGGLARHQDLTGARGEAGRATRARRCGRC